MPTENFATWLYTLRRGHSDNPAEGACAMDAVNWLAHGKHGDAPECACPVIAEFVIRGNDAMPDDVRQRFLPYLHRIAGSRSNENRSARIRVLRLAALRRFAPRALDAAGLHDHAETLRKLPNDIDMSAASEAAKQAVAQAVETVAAVQATWVGTTRVAWAEEAAAWNAATRVAWAAQAAAVNAAVAAEPTWGETVAGRAAAAAAEAEAWDEYFTALDAALNAGPQGEPWSANAVSIASNLFDQACLAASQVD